MNGIAKFCIYLNIVTTTWCGAALAAQPTRQLEHPAAVAETYYGAAMLIPGLINGDGTGPFMEMAKVIAAYAPGVELKIQVRPVAWAYHDTRNSRADFGFPAMRIPQTGGERPLHRYSTERFGVVAFVLYSKTGRNLSREIIDQAARAGRPLTILAPPVNWGFPTQQVSDIKTALRQVAAGRVDALLWAQEEVDLMLREGRISGIHRTHFGDFDDVFLIAQSPRGDRVDNILTQAIRAARKSGDLQRAYSKVHGKFKDWQPK